MARSLKEARKAYKKKDVQAMIKAHNVKDLKKFEASHHHSKGKYLKSIVYGGLDGIITTFAVVAGVAGASLSSGILLILGFANLVADGISMAVGDYLSSKAERDFYSTEKEREKWEAKNYPKGEKMEMIDIYMKRGLSKFDASKLVSIISKKKNFFIDQMMIEELKLMDSSKSSPLKNALVTFISFSVFGFIPILIFLTDFIFPGFIGRPFLYTIILTGVALFLLGIAKFKFTRKHWLRSALETLIIGGLAAGVAYLVGYLLSGLA